MNFSGICIHRLEPPSEIKIKFNVLYENNNMNKEISVPANSTLSYMRNKIIKKMGIS